MRTALWTALLWATAPLPGTPPGAVVATGGGRAVLTAGSGPAAVTAGRGPAVLTARSVAASAVSAARAGPGVPVPAVARLWPTGARPVVVRGWEPPATPYGPGHRGVDLAAGPGSPVRAVAPGRVTFAGRVAGKGVVSVELAGTGDPPLRTTYEPVRAAVRNGTEVAAGEIVGTLEPTGSHCPAGCLHWGLRRADTYLDPLTLLPPWLLSGGPSRLLPVLGVPLPPQRR